MQITNLTSVKTDKIILGKIARAVLLPKYRQKFSELSIVLVDEEKIKGINKKYRKKNRSTDVLSFPDLNEIFVCLSVVEKQAKNLKVSFKDELTRVAAHGILHLLGFDHQKKDQALEMQKEEDGILKKISKK